MTMIRKQLYIAADQQRKLRSLAARWGCTEAEVMRTALDRLQDPISDIDRVLADAGILATWPDDGAPLSDEDLVALEWEMDQWAEAHPAPLGLGEAVIEDRR